MSKKDGHNVLCIVCGKEFIGFSNNKYCSKKCCKKAEAIKNSILREKKCKLCGEKFMGTATQQYCLLCKKRIPKITWDNLPEDKKEKQREIALRARKIQQEQFDAQSDEEKKVRKEKHGNIFKKWRESLTKEEWNNYQEKAHNSLKANANKRKREKGYAWTFERPGASAYARQFYNKNSKVNLKWLKQLKESGYNVSSEFELDGYRYDFKINNTLIEINPWAFHNSNIIVKVNYKLKDRLYHYNKLKCALDNGYNCIMVRPRMDLEDVLTLLNKKTIQSKIKTHWFNIKTKEHLIGDEYNEKEMTIKGYAKLYDGGENYL